MCGDLEIVEHIVEPREDALWRTAFYKVSEFGAYAKWRSTALETAALIRLHMWLASAALAYKNVGISNEK